MNSEIEKELIKKTAKELKNLGILEEEEEQIPKPSKRLLSEEEFRELMGKVKSSSRKFDCLVDNLSSNMLITPEMYKYLEHYINTYEHEKLHRFFNNRIVYEETQTLSNDHIKGLVIVAVVISLVVFGLITILF